MQLKAHKDANALGTSISSLTPASSFRGGLYTQMDPTDPPSKRRFIHLEQGDTIYHDFTIGHGVEVVEGERFALVLWFLSNKEACQTGKGIEVVSWSRYLKNMMRKAGPVLPLIVFGFIQLMKKIRE